MVIPEDYNELKALAAEKGYTGKQDKESLKVFLSTLTEDNDSVEEATKIAEKEAAEAIEAEKVAKEAAEKAEKEKAEAELAETKRLEAIEAEKVAKNNKWSFILNRDVRFPDWKKMKWETITLEDANKMPKEWYN